MTHNQYFEMAENFAKYAGMYVPFKLTNLYYGKGCGEVSKHKYNHYTGTLYGVGVAANAEHFIIRREGYGLVCVHYTKVTWPL